MKLSICIPTYNRAKYLSQCLQSIITQITDDVEIVISDNASKDNTEDVVFTLQIQGYNIKYFRNDVNIGPDKNFENVVEKAIGEYCWLLSDDDMLEEFAISKVIKNLSTESDVYLLDDYICDINMKIFKRRHRMQNVKDKYNFNNNKELIRFLNDSNPVGLPFGYISSICFLKQRWDACKSNPSFQDSAYSHVSRILNILLQENTSFSFVDEGLVLNRVNLSYIADDDDKIFDINVHGYLLISEYFSQSYAVYKAYKRMLNRNYPIADMYIIDFKIGERALVGFENIGVYWYKLIIIRYFKVIIKIILMLRRLFKKLSGAFPF